MNRARCVAAVLLFFMAGCSKKSTVSEPPDADAPDATPTVGSGPAAGTAKRTGAGEYDDPFGKNKEPINVVIDNQCSDTVMLFFGEKPRPGSNYHTTMSGQSQRSELLMPGDKAWLLDEEENGIASAEVELDTTEITIDHGCDRIDAR